MSTAAIFDRLNKNIASNVEKATSVNAKFGFDIGGDGGGQWTINLRKDNASGSFVTQPIDADANVTISMSADDWSGVISGKTNAMQAFMMGKIKVKPDPASLFSWDPEAGTAR